MSPTLVECSACLILLNLLYIMTYDEGYKLWRSSLCSFTNPPFTSSLLGSDIVLSFSNTFYVFMFLSAFSIDRYFSIMELFSRMCGGYVIAYCGDEGDSISGLRIM